MHGSRTCCRAVRAEAEQIRAQARAAGEAEGRAAGLAAARTELAARRSAALAAALAGDRGRADEMIAASSSSDAVELALALAEQIIARRSTCSPSA